MLTLHQYPPVWGLPSLSPFCIKVETYLRMADLPYQVVIENNPRKGPKGKMPMLRDGERIIPDSSFIIDYLREKYAIKLDVSLSAGQKAIAHATQKMIEENLYFVVLYSRWIDPVGKAVVDKEFRQFFPALVSGLALKWIRGNLKKQSYFQGIGRHTRDEVYAVGCRDIMAISHLMGENLFFFGDAPSSVDATVYGFLSTIAGSGFDNPLKKCLSECGNLVNYCERIKQKYY